MSGGIHIRQREPCCWKWTSSIAHRSTSGSTARIRSFFMRLLPLGVGVGQLWTRLAQAEPQLPEQALALADSQVDGERLLHPGRQRLAVPEVAAQPDLPWRLPQG